MNTLPDDYRKNEGADMDEPITVPTRNVSVLPLLPYLIGLIFWVAVVLSLSSCGWALIERGIGQ